MKKVRIQTKYNDSLLASEAALWKGDVIDLLESLPKKKIFDLVITSPPYNIGKAYEKKSSLNDYFEFHQNVIKQIVKRLKPNSSVCWQVGNHVNNKKNEIFPLDFGFHEIFSSLGLKLKNRIVWQFGHGLHSTRRFSGRYEVILWYTMSDQYHFNLDAVRVPQRYPGKRKYAGPGAAIKAPTDCILEVKKQKNEKVLLIFKSIELDFENAFKEKYPPIEVDASREICVEAGVIKKGQTLVRGEFSGNILGKNPGDIWDIPNVKGNHVEKTNHPCQFPVALVQRLILAMTKKNQLVFDPFMGVGSTGVAALLNNRKFLGADTDKSYVLEAKKRISQTIKGEVIYREDKPIYDFKESNLSIFPETFKKVNKK